MKNKKSSIAIIKSIADKMGYQTKYLTKEGVLSRLMISHNGKICILNSSLFGWYPEMKRWQYQLFHSKILTQTVLTSIGYKTIPTIVMKPEDHSSVAAIKGSITNKIKKYPVIVKPDTGFKGNGISIATSATKLQTILREHHKNKNSVLIQPILNHDEYRILLVNNKVEVVHIKKPHYVLGNGTSTIQTLLDKLQPREKDEVFIKQQFIQHKLTPMSVLPKGKKFLYHLTRYSAPGDYYESKKIPKKITLWAQKLAKDISSTTIGIDIFAPKGILDTDSYMIIELNANSAFEYLQSRYNDPEKMEGIIKNTLSHYFKTSS